MASQRFGKSALHRAIAGFAAPVYLVSRAMKIIYANEATSAWTGLEADQLIGLTCVWQSAVDAPPSRRIANGLCPPPDAFDRAPSEFNVTGGISGNSEFRRAIGIPLPSDNDGTLLVVVFGPPRSSPEVPDDDVIRDGPHLHAAICHMQSESASRIAMDLVVGRSSAAARIRRQIEVVVQTASSTVIVGPCGSGRRQVAQLIHAAGEAALAGPLIPIECGVSDAESIQEVIKGLYREQRRHPDEPPGRLLLLDADQLSEAAERELLGFLQLPDFRLPLLATAGGDGRERMSRELWQRLSTVVIELPSLAARREDVPFLLQSILEQGNGASAQFSGFDDAAMSVLTRYRWPGELEELIEVVDHARKSASLPIVTFNDLPSFVRIAVRDDLSTEPDHETTIDLDQFLADVELELIQRAVGVASGNKAHAARLLGISRARLLRRLPDDV